MDTLQEDGLTVSLEWEQDAGETQIVVAELRAAKHLGCPVLDANAGERSMIPSGTGHERDGSDSGLAALAASLGPRLRPAATFATTEHFNLQTARAITVSEANGRAGIYLAALSCNLIALAFIGQMSQLGVAFYAFALILLPVLAFVGVSTFLRLVQSSIEEIAYAHRIGLLRGFYLRLAPELEPYVVVVREAG